MADLRGSLARRHPCEGIPDLTEELRRSVKESVDQILMHLSTVQPRREDLPLAYNAELDGKNHASGRITVPAGETGSVVVRARNGHVAYISSLSIMPSDQDFAGSEVLALLTGRVVQRVHEGRHRRPLVMDRHDDLVIQVTNTSGDERVFEFRLDGWLRRIVPVL